MQITPAILTSDIDLFTTLINKMTFTNTLDIDIIRPPFVENQTVQFEEIKHLINYNNISIGFHLMVENPKQDLINMFNSGLDSKSIRVYLHQESDLASLKDFEWPSNWSKSVAVKIESELKDLSFYNQFDEVQLMSIETGAQGNPFNAEVVNRVNKLRSMGYQKTISLDGGINLETINLIKGLDINRISVGSYFQKSQNPKESYRILKEAIEK